MYGSTIFLSMSVEAAKDFALCRSNRPVVQLHGMGRNANRVISDTPISPNSGAVAPPNRHGRDPSINVNSASNVVCNAHQSNVELNGLMICPREEDFQGPAFLCESSCHHRTYATVAALATHQTDVVPCHQSCSLKRLQTVALA